MGLTPDTHEKRTYVSIVNGKFAKKVPAGTEGAIERESTNPQTKETKTVHELLYKSVSGMIDSFEIDETGKYGVQLKINMSDGMDKFTVSLNMKGSEAETFLKCIPNIDFKAEVILAPYNFTPEDSATKKIGMNILQKNEKVKWFYSKETPNGMPISEEELDRDGWDILRAQQAVFLKKKAKQFALENFDYKNHTVNANTLGGNETTDDLPF